MRLGASPLSAVFFLVCLETGCSPVSTNEPQKGFVLLSEKQEFLIGDQYAALVERQARAGKLRMAGIDGDYLDALGKRLVAASKRTSMPCRFYVIDDATINAFAVPGHIYVYRGLVELAENESEFASVVGHEIGHVVARHSAKKISKAAALSLGQELLLAFIFGDSPSGELARVGADLMRTGAIKKYGRDEERQADLLAIEECDAAGISPAGMVTLFRKFERIFREHPNTIELFFADHPYSAERAARAEAYARGTAVARGLPDDSPEFHSFRDAVKSLPAPPQSGKSWLP